MHSWLDHCGLAAISGSYHTLSSAWSCYIFISYFVTIRDWDCRVWIASIIWGRWLSRIVLRKLANQQNFLSQKPVNKKKELTFSGIPRPCTSVVTFMDLPSWTGLALYQCWHLVSCSKGQSWKAVIDTGQDPKESNFFLLNSIDCYGALTTFWINW